MATGIVAIRTATSASGGTHSHISYVKTTDGRVLPRADVIQRIQNGWEQFCSGYSGPQVIVVRCPHCGAGDYIRTTADATTADNLLRLPRF